MGELWRRLGRFVQGLLDKIRGRKSQEYESISSIFGTIDTNTLEFNKVDKVEIPSCAEVTFELVYDADSGKNELEKFVNTYRTLLPKRYRVKTLLISLAANQPWDYIAVDLSQYEEKGIAHYIIGRTNGLEEMAKEYLNENEDDAEWLKEELENVQGNLYSAVVGEATLLHWEELDLWEVDYD